MSEPEPVLKMQPGQIECRNCGEVIIEEGGRWWHKDSLYLTCTPIRVAEPKE